MNIFKDMVLDRNIDAGGLFVVEKAVPEFRKDAGFLPRKVPYGVDVSGKEIVFHIHTVENIFRYDDLIRERRFYVVDMLGYLKKGIFFKKADIFGGYRHIPLEERGYFPCKVRYAGRFKNG